MFKKRYKVRKTDMIEISGVKIEFKYMGLFTTQDVWTHPRITESTCEIIYVTEGDVYLAEGEKEYSLKAGDLIILAKDHEHWGFKKSFGKTSFYWLHFDIEGIVPETQVINNFTHVSLFKELLHNSSAPLTPQYMKDSVLLHLLAEISSAKDKKEANTLASSIFEWTRINVKNGLTVEKIAEHFGYNSEHISRLIKKQYGVGLKAIIDEFLINKAKNYLCNTTYSVKEISDLLEFNDPNTFIHFFKYHEKKSPTKYKNTYSNTHMNKE